MNLKDELLQLNIVYQEKIRKLEEENKQVKERLRNEIDELEKERQKHVTKEKQRPRESPPLRLNLTQENIRLTTEEREAGDVLYRVSSRSIFV